MNAIGHGLLLILLACGVVVTFTLATHGGGTWLAIPMALALGVIGGDLVSLTLGKVPGVIVGVVIGLLWLLVAAVWLGLTFVLVPAGGA
jgi:hypothetical protein